MTAVTSILSHLNLCNIRCDVVLQGVWYRLMPFLQWVLVVSPKNLNNISSKIGYIMERFASTSSLTDSYFKKLRIHLLLVFISLGFVNSALALEVETTLDNKIKREAGHLIYKVAVTNTSSNTRNDVTLTLNLPSGLEFRGYSALPAYSCSYCSGVVSYNMGSLAQGETKLFIFPLRSNNLFDDNFDSDMTLSASVTHGSDASPETKESVVSYVEEESILLKTAANKEFVEAGEQVIFEIAVGNIGSSGFAGSYISASVPQGTTFVSASDGGTLQGSSVVWESSAILSGGSGEKRYFTVALPESANNGDVYKTSVAWARNSSLGASQMSESMVIVRNANTKTFGVSVFGDTAMSGQATDVRVTVVNTSNNILSNAVLNIKPGSFSRLYLNRTRPVSATSSSGTVYADSWTGLQVEELLPGESTSLLIPISVYQIIDGLPFEFFSVLQDENGNTLQSANTTLLWDDDQSIRMNVAADKQKVEEGEFFEYELSFGNLTDSAYQNVELALSLPAQIEVVSASDGGVVTDTSVNWELGTLSGRDSGKRTIKVKAIDGVSAGELLEASATLHNGGLGISRSSEVVAVVNNRPLDLYVAQIGDVRTPGQYNYLRYVVTNTSNITRTDVKLDISPSVGSRVAGNDSYPAAPSNGYYYSSDWPTYDIGNLAPGEEYILTVPFSGYQQTDGAPWVSDAILSDSISAFVQGTKPTTLYSVTNSVAFTIATGKQIIQPGELVTFEVGIGNIGDVTLQNLEIPLELPGEVTAQSASNDGTIDGSNVLWEVGSLAAGESIKRFLTVKVDDELAAGEAFKIFSRLENSSKVFARASEVLVVSDTMPLTLTATSTGDTRTPSHYGYSKYVITNTGSTARTDVQLAVSTDAGERVYGTQTYPYVNNSTYYATDWIKFNFDSIAAGESKVIFLPLHAYQQIDGKPWVKNAILSDSLDTFIQSARTTFSYSAERTLSSHISASRSVVAIGEDVSFEVAYGNESSTNMQNLVLEVDIPEGLTVENITDGGSLNGNTLQWELSTLTAGYAAKRSFTAMVDSAMFDGQALEVKSNISQGGESLSRSSESLVVKDETLLQLDVSYNHGVTRYTVSNTDTVSHADVVLIIQAGNYTRFNMNDSVPQLGSSTKYANERAVYEFGELEPGETRSVLIPFSGYQANAGGLSVSHAVLESSTNDYIQSTTPTFLYTSELGGELPNLSLSTTNHHVTAGDEIDFNVVLGNPSEDIVESAMLQLTVPNNAEFVSASGVYEVIDNVVYWPLGNMPAGNWHQLSLTLKADSDLVAGDVIQTHSRIVTNTATRTMAAASEVNVVQGRQLSVSASQTVGYPLLQGASMQLSIGVSNNKLTELADVELYYMPAAGTYISSSNVDGGSCTSGSTCYFRDWIKWDLANMSGQSQTALSVSPTLLNNSSRASLGSVLTSTFYADHSSQGLSPSVLTVSYGVGDTYEIDTNHDSDGDGIPDFWELRYSHLANWLDSSDADDDFDGDGYTNLQEYMNGLSPDNRDPKDTDSDMLLDSVELALGLDPLSDDTDGDGLIDRLDNWPTIFNTPQEGLVDVVGLGDITDDGADDFAVVLVNSGEVTAEVYSGATGEVSHTIAWPTAYQDVQVYILDDLNGNGAVEIGILGMIENLEVEEPNIKPQFFVRDSKSGARVNVYNWPANWLETKIVMLDDVTGDGVKDFGLQGRFIVAGARPQLVVKDAATTDNVRTYSYPNLFLNPEYMMLSDYNGDGVNEVGLFGIIERNGKVQVKITDGLDANNKLRAYNFPANWRNVSWHQLSDMTGDTENEWGLFGTRIEDNKPQLFTKYGDSVAGTAGIYSWADDLELPSFHLIPDLTGDAVKEVAVGGFRTSIGRFQVAIKDGADRASTLVNLGWPSIWSDASFHVVGDLTNDGTSEVALLGMRTNGSYELNIKDGNPANGVYRSESLGSDWAEKPKLKLIGDTDFDGTPTTLIYGKNQNGNSVFMLID